MRRTTRGTRLPVRQHVRLPVRHLVRLDGRRGAVIASSAAVLCLGALLAGCGSGGDDGYVAVGAVGPSSEGPSAKAAPPEGDVSLISLDGSLGSGGEPGGSGRPEPAEGSDAPDGAGASAAAGEGDGSPGGSASGADGTAEPGGGSGTSAGSGGSGGGGATDEGPADPGPGSPDPEPGPQSPAALSVGPVERTPTDKRWCEKVTLELRNTGDKPVKSGTVTFATHIIGALGIDWATIESAQKLPVPIEGGEHTEETWPVCVDEWRVPLGMHIETQDVDVDWK
ncbi:hypothetical protein [Streptomyces sp. 8N616]|uniref:hypothetical protein n=1 Tax=Streptomyces sp. 8N616 TaxID=3457414 RepID=UPI003FD0E63A